MLRGGKKFCIVALLSVATLSVVFLGAPVARATGDLTFGVRLAEQISLTLSSEVVNLVALPTEGGSFVSNGLTSRVDTNSVTGYILSMSVDGSSTSLVNAMRSDAYVPSNITGVVTSTTMPNNNWGFSTDGENFSSLPPINYAAVLKTADGPIENDNTGVTFGVKIDNATTAGVYESTVIFTAYAK
jgi:hypothetical protein